MKILITENQLDKIINRYLDIQFKDLTLEIDDYKNLHFMHGKNDVVLISRDIRMGDFFIEFDRNLSGWDHVREIFPKNVIERRKIFYEWFKKHYPEEMKNVLLEDTYCADLNG